MSEFNVQLCSILQLTVIALFPRQFDYNFIDLRSTRPLYLGPVVKKGTVVKF